MTIPQDSGIGRTYSALTGGVKSKCLKSVKSDFRALDIGHIKRPIFKTSLIMKLGCFYIKFPFVVHQRQ